MKVLNWLFKQGDDGVSPAMGIVVLGIIFILAGIVGGIETGSIWP